MYQVEIALHYAILTGLPMDSDIGVVEKHAKTVFLKREIVLVNFGNAAVFEINMPVGAFHINNKHVVTLFVEKRKQALCRAHGYVMFG